MVISAVRSIALLDLVTNAWIRVRRLLLLSILSGSVRRLCLMWSFGHRLADSSYETNGVTLLAWVVPLLIYWLRILRASVEKFVFLRLMRRRSCVVVWTCLCVELVILIAAWWCFVCCCIACSIPYRVQGATLVVRREGSRTRHLLIYALSCLARLLCIGRMLMLIRSVWRRRCVRLGGYVLMCVRATDLLDLTVWSRVSGAGPSSYSTAELM